MTQLNHVFKENGQGSTFCAPRCTAESPDMSGSITAQSVEANENEWGIQGRWQDYGTHGGRMLVCKKTIYCNS